MRLVVACWLAQSSYLTAITFTPATGPAWFSALQLLDLIVSSIGALFLTLGLFVSDTSLVVSTWVLASRFAVQAPIDFEQVVLILIPFLLGPGHWSLDARLFRQSPPAVES